MAGANKNLNTGGADVALHTKGQHSGSARRGNEVMPCKTPFTTTSVGVHQLNLERSYYLISNAFLLVYVIVFVNILQH